jgi:hypothetical protein
LPASSSTPSSELDSIGSTTIALASRLMQSSTWVTCRAASACGSSTIRSSPSSFAAFLPPATLLWKYAICRLNVTKQIVFAAATAGVTPRASPSSPTGASQHLLVIYPTPLGTS